MASVIATARPDAQIWSDKALKLSAGGWFLTAVFGQWFFAYYIVAYYGGSAVQGDWQAWTDRMIHGIVAGDPIGNIAVFIHILLAFVITFCGPLQLVPQIRSRFPTFHHLNGRIYIVTAFIISFGAIYMQWSRENLIGGIWGQIGTSLDGLLIIIFAYFAIRRAMQRRLAEHRKWALRLFIVVSGVWFFRVGRGLWHILTDGQSYGVNATLTGPFDIILGFAGYLLPLLILELYLRARDSGKVAGRWMMAILLSLSIVATAVGVYGAAYMMWIPVI